MLEAAIPHRDTLPPTLRYTAAELDDALNDPHDPHDLAFKELARALDANIGDEDLAALLVQLRRDGLLARSQRDRDGNPKIGITGDLLHGTDRVKSVQGF